MAKKTFDLTDNLQHVRTTMQLQYGRMNHGFTLIELAVVLVIIGLLAGGILFGRDLVALARIRAVISEVQEIRLLTGTFRQKYNCLPGDCSNAETQHGWPRADVTRTINGDGNGRIGTNYNEAYTYMPENEIGMFWWHLYSAGMLAGMLPCGTTGIPTPHTYRDRCVRSSLRQANFWVGYAEPSNAGNYIQLGSDSNVVAGYWVNRPLSEGITPEEGFAMDSKLDNGAPYTGTVIASSASSFMYIVPWPNKSEPLGNLAGEPAPFRCVQPGGATYANFSENISPNRGGCIMQFRLGF